MRSVTSEGNSGRTYLPRRHVHRHDAAPSSLAVPAQPEAVPVGGGLQIHVGVDALGLRPVALKEIVELLEDYG